MEWVNRKRKFNDMHLSGNHYVSARALEAVLQSIREHGLPESSSRSSIARQRTATANVSTPFGDVIQSFKVCGNKGGDVQLYCQHPLAMLWLVLRDSEHFKQSFDTMMAKQGTTPIRIVVYSDEITPGRELVPNDRKAWAVYWSNS